MCGIRQTGRHIGWLMLIIIPLTLILLVLFAGVQLRLSIFMVTCVVLMPLLGWLVGCYASLAYQTKMKKLLNKGQIVKAKPIGRPYNSFMSLVRTFLREWFANLLFSPLYKGTPYLVQNLTATIDDKEVAFHINLFEGEILEIDEHDEISVLVLAGTLETLSLPIILEEPTAMAA